MNPNSKPFDNKTDIEEWIDSHIQTPVAAKQIKWWVWNLQRR